MYMEEKYREEESHGGNPEMLIAYGITVLSGFVMGLLVGWLL